MNSEDEKQEFPGSFDGPDIDDETDNAVSVRPREGAGEAHAVRPLEQLWLISYSDFMTIMMIFFLAMYGYTYMKKKEVEQRIDRFASIAAEMKQRMSGDVRITSGLDKVTVEMGEGVLFQSGRADLNASAARNLAALGASIQSTEGDVIVEGHTDNVPVRGRYRSNWELSAARAFSVIQALTRAGVPSHRLAAWGFGENRPIVDNGTPEGRQRNRRIAVVILKKRVQTSS